MKKKGNYLIRLLLMMVMLVSISMPNATIATAKSGPTAETSSNAAIDGCPSYTNGSRGGGGGGSFIPGPGGAKTTPKVKVKTKAKSKSKKKSKKKV